MFFCLDSGKLDKLNFVFCLNIIQYIYVHFILFPKSGCFYPNFIIMSVSIKCILYKNKIAFVYD